jgi:predicted nuclease with TOPRIM domain
MKNDLTEILRHLETLKAKAEKLGKEQKTFLKHIAEAEAQLEAAKEHLESTRRTGRRKADD